ncbi:hypothetical protein JTE90_010270 [Oedothorax gibbosus]|uniref:Uncharacterized protein n=1 Tax=Oedothorax gibbosus TaxID=931172 RepID=A0AAV6TDZ0_9ARAC|nr:hypothetical protein JTE90_010270 [Oedothorax gibbosus]
MNLSADADRAPYKEGSALGARRRDPYGSTFRSNRVSKETMESSGISLTPGASTSHLFTTPLMSLKNSGNSVKSKGLLSPLIFQVRSLGAVSLDRR